MCALCPNFPLSPHSSVSSCCIRGLIYRELLRKGNPCLPQSTNDPYDRCRFQTVLRSVSKLFVVNLHCYDLLLSFGNLKEIFAKVSVPFVTWKFGVLFEGFNSVFPLVESPCDQGTNTLGALLSSIAIAKQNTILARCSYHTQSALPIEISRASAAGISTPLSM